MAVAQSTVVQYYEAVLRRTPTAAEVSSYESFVNADAVLTTLQGIAQTTVNPVIRLYQAAFDRVPDSAGLTYWVNQYVNGGGNGTLTLSQMASGFSGSAEFQADYGSLSNLAYVNALYVNILQRTGDQAGINYWVSQLNAGTSRAVVLNSFAQSPEFVQNSQPAIEQFQANSADGTETYTGSLFEQVPYTLTTSPDIATAVTFLAPKAYTPGGNDFVNTLQNEDVLTGDIAAGPTSLTGDLGNPNDSGVFTVAPTMTNVQTINIAFTNTASGQSISTTVTDMDGTVEGASATFTEAQGMTLDFQDIVGTDTANITRISANLRQKFINLDADVGTLGIANTSEQAKVTVTYLNNELAGDDDAVTVILNDASLSSTQSEYNANGGALKIEATEARGSDLQHQIETYNVVTFGRASTVATFQTGVSDFDDLVVGERPQTVNIDAQASLAIGTMRWLGNRVETYTANMFQQTGLHQVGTNGLGFVNFNQINNVVVAGAANVTLANVGTWETESDSDFDVDFTLDASQLTGNLTADISNAALSADAVFTGGSGSDRFYVAGMSGEDDGQGSSLSNPAPTGASPYYQNRVAAAATVLAEISGGEGIDSLTVQSNSGASSINLATGSSGLEYLNLVQGIGTGTAGGAWSVDLTDGGFELVTINNQSESVAMGLTVTGLDVSQQTLSVRSTGLKANGDPDTDLTAPVSIAFTQSAGLVGGTLSLELGHAADDRATSDAFSWKNHTGVVSLQDNGAQGTTEVDNLALVLNSAGARGTGPAQINVKWDDFETQTTLTSEVEAENAVSIGYQAGLFSSSDYSMFADSTSGAYQNALNSTTYDGSSYLGTQDVTFGSGTTYTALIGKSHSITTGVNDDRVDLTYMTTQPNRTLAGSLLSNWLLNTEIAMGDNASTTVGDELVLSANLADPRLVVSPDLTYDGYFQNWTGIETLTINNRNGLTTVAGAAQTNDAGETTAYVAFDAYAEINNTNLDVVNLNDVDGEVAIGFRFTNDLTINVDTTIANPVAGQDTVNGQSQKWTTLNSFSEADNTINVDASDGIVTSGTAAGNFVQYTNTGANLSNNVRLNYNAISNNNVTINSTSLVVKAGSLDYVDFNGDLGGTDSVAGTAATLTVTTADAWTAAGETTTYDFSDIVNGISSVNGAVVFDGSNEINTTTGLTIFGSLDEGIGSTVGVTNRITATGGDDIIVSGGINDTLIGGKGDDQITYSITASATANTVLIIGDLVVAAPGDTVVGASGSGDDVIQIIGMDAGDSATVVGGAGDDVVTLGLESNTYIFAASRNGPTTTGVATVAQVVQNVGDDLIVNFTATSATDKFQLYQSVFGTSIEGASGSGTIATGDFEAVTGMDVLLDTKASSSIIVVQNGANADAEIYYVDTAVTANTVSVSNLVQAGDAVRIAYVDNVTGTLAASNFIVI